MTIHPAGRWVFLLPQAAGCIRGGLDRSLIDLSFTDGERRRDQAISRPAGHQRCGVVLLALVVYLIFSAGESLSSRLSASALQVLTKVMGLLLTSIAIQMMITGERSSEGSFPQST